jgi:lipoate synthase
VKAGTGNGTFKILGEKRTRNAGFAGKPANRLPPDTAEPQRFKTIRIMTRNMRHTSNRDDLPDLGASFRSETILPQTGQSRIRLELLNPTSRPERIIEHVADAQPP